MSIYMYQHHQQQQLHAPPTHLNTASSTHHGGRSRRGPRVAGQNAPRQFRGLRSMREPEAPTTTAFRLRFEAGRSFDLDDDLEFCPNLLTEDDLHSIHSSASDRSSLSSDSPDSSPLQQQIQPAQQVTPTISLSPSSSAASYITSNPLHNSLNQMGFPQPTTSRTRKVIPIVNPQTGVTLSSPPTSISPGMMHMSQRRW